MIHKEGSLVGNVVEVTEVVPMRTIPVARRTPAYSTIFEGSGRKLLWDGLGQDVSTANSAREVCEMAGLNYRVQTEAIYTEDGIKIPNMVCTRRYDDLGNGMEMPSTVYGVVTNRYAPVQNSKGFEFIDSLFGHHGFEVETAGQFGDGKIVWVEAKLPEKVMVDEKICPYLVFTNRHDGQGSVKIFLTPVRVICRNTLNMAIKGAKGRSFSVKHTSSAEMMLEQAKETLDNYHLYLDAMGEKIEQQKRILLSDLHFDQLLGKMIPIDTEKDSAKQQERALLARQEIRNIWLTAPDLDGYENSGFKFVNVISDWATHHDPVRRTSGYRDNLFQSTLAGNPYIDKAVELIDEFEAVSNRLVAM
jgi:phage/plasmid-like protein (TIGR03299 family)